MPWGRCQAIGSCIKKSPTPPCPPPLGFPRLIPVDLGEDGDIGSSSVRYEPKLNMAILDRWFAYVSIEG